VNENNNRRLFIMKVRYQFGYGGFGAYRISTTEGLLGSSHRQCGVRLPCRRPVTMDRTVRMRRRRASASAPHPGLPDLLGFGRRIIQMDAGEIEETHAVPDRRAAGDRCQCRPSRHPCQFHAAMGNMVNADPDMADVAARAIAKLDRDLIMFSQPNAEIVRAARKVGLRVLTIFLADRAYDANANLVSRKLPNSVITSPEAVAKRVQRFLDSGTVEDDRRPNRSRSRRARSSCTAIRRDRSTSRPP